ncbi:N-succinylarginine dihydrolase [Legionella quinlivanii]|uniref:N-succinylarginine dihydrolase n=1 Tax=Legionella quinlivanii TaxID=45073 RepID=A0A364LMQ6_9GAMM|nr:N-succinylarginine dihydrolase [Legionella quinlivanii]RAP38084.1 N-succinylarginine dihydrolase [Legionella quinlivanii]
MKSYELNMDGLVGPTHNYAGLSLGNIASTSNALSIANPQAAALQGLAKMRFLHGLGLKQAVLPPHQRPNLNLLMQMGFYGSTEQMLSQASREAPEILAAAYSASSMWTANAATVIPSIDSSDRRVHFTAANLISNLHRHQEASFSSRLLKKLFNTDSYFSHHSSLPASVVTSDEGAANHSRLAANHNQAGIHLFVYGKRALWSTYAPAPQRFPARQTYEASSAIARAHLLNPNKVVFACQNPLAIDKGVFHNDVIAVANESVLLIHQQAFLNQAEVIRELKDKADFDLTIVEINDRQISIDDAVSSYLFNSQLLTLEDGSMTLVAPSECQYNQKVHETINHILSSPNNPINHCYFMDLKQSMRNGGGPACLRLRVLLQEEELAEMHQGVLINESLLTGLEQWVKRHYRDRLHAQDFLDPLLVDEVLIALDELTQILDLGSIYPFQQA